jgi:pyrroline-5-carboxylate reductase
VESLVDAGVLIGLPRAVAEDAAIGTVEGAVALLRQRGPDFTRLKAEVTSPGGVTAAGLAELEIGAARGALLKAVRAGHARARELGRG